MRNRSPIFEDMVQGHGGIANGRFTVNSKDTLPYDPSSNLLGTESNEVLTDEIEIGLAV